MTEIIAITAVAIVAWFAAGTIWNIRRGRLLMHWMQGGLPVLGERTTVRWLGSSAVEMVIRDGKAPFASVTLVIFLEPRDMPWSWALGRARGRRDTLIIRGVLRGTPKIELEALDPASWSGREALQARASGMVHSRSRGCWRPRRALWQRCGARLRRCTAGRSPARRTGR